MTTDLLIPEETNSTQQDTAPAQHIPDKFKDPDTGEIRTDALLKSYLSLEKKLSERAPSPDVPAHVGDYCIDCAHGLFQPEEAINERLRAKGFTQDQAQEVYDLTAEKMIPLILDVAAEFQAEREVSRLEDYFGGADKWREISGQLLNFGRQNLPPEVLKGLAGSYEGVMALYNMMSGNDAQKPPRARAEVKPGVSEDDIQSMMRDPKYWREKDPSVVARVTKGFQSLYGTK